MKRITACLAMVIFCAGLLLCFFYPPKEYSSSERRKLAQFPECSLERVVSGAFMEDFEEYAADQFPFREQFRSVKAAFSRYVLRQKDDNQIYMAEGHIGKLDPVMDETSLLRAASRFRYVCDTYFKDGDHRLYFSLIPDKNSFLADKNGYLSYDYERFSSYIKENTSDMKYIDLVTELSVDDYYRTDPHWRQENLIDVAEKIGQEMGITLPDRYEKNILPKPFYGTYYGQLGLPFEPDEIVYLTNRVLDQLIVTNHETGKKGGIYDMDKAAGDDPYEMFLSGPVSLLTIENPQINSNRELIVFRDSFGSSLMPLLAQSYKKVTLVDIRYMHPDQLKNYIEFTDQDVLFLYCASVLNHSETIK